MLPILQISPVFEANLLGYDVTRIPALIRTQRGSLLAFCEARSGLGGDWSDVDLLIRRSEDEGTSWAPAEVLVKGDGGPASNPVPIALRDGSILFLYHRGYRDCFLIRSTDDGRTWSAPRNLTPTFDAFRPEYDWKVLAPGPGHGIQLANGRIVVAVWLCAPAGPDVPGGDHRPSCTATLYSDDNGESWQCGAIVAPSTEIHKHPNECAVAELSDGRILMNMRNESSVHQRLVATSPDGAREWTSPEFSTSLLESVCMGSLLATIDPATGKRVLLFCNPNSRHQSQEYRFGMRSRENGTIQLSDDDGQTWITQRVIDAGPFGYSDLAASPNGTIFCIYDAGLWGEAPSHRATHVALAKFSIEWIRQAPQPSRRSA